MAEFAVQSASRDGVELTFNAANAGGDKFPNTGREAIIVKNDDASSVDVTLDIQETVDGQAVTDRTVTVAAGTQKIIGPFHTTVYNDGDGNMNLAYSSVTSLSVAVVKI